MSYRDHFVLINHAPFYECSEDRVQGSQNCSDSWPKLEQFLEAKRLSDKECIKLPFILVTSAMCVYMCQDHYQHLYCGLICHSIEALAT